jgi:hypothetical protein
MIEDERWWKQLEEDERQIRRELNTKGSPLWVESDEEKPETKIGFKVFFTQFGAVFHSNPNCGHLHGPKIGPHYEAQWCELCKKEAERLNQAPLPKKGILLGKSVKIFHTNHRCPKGRLTEMTALCKSCG